MNAAGSRRLRLWLVAGAVAAVLLRHWVALPVLIAGRSMEPTLLPGQLVVVNKLAYRLHPPQRGDLVLVRAGQSLLAKRIIGLPGEEISARGGLFYADGVPLSEPYVQFKQDWDIAAGKIATDCYVIAGDNRQESTILVVHRRRIVGRLVGRSPPG